MTRADAMLAIKKVDLHNFVDCHETQWSICWWREVPSQLMIKAQALGGFGRGNILISGGGISITCSPDRLTDALSAILRWTP